MHRMCDEDSGRSSCSAGSLKINPIQEINEDVTIDKVWLHQSKTQEASTNTDLKVSLRPRSCISILKSPDERDPFPSYRPPRNQQNSFFNVFDNQRRGGLSNAHSTFDIISSTQIEEPKNKPSNSISLTTIQILDDKNTIKQGNFRRGKPVQRAASRLYRADGILKGECKGCVGPEFIVRASQPVKHIDLTHSAIVEKRIIDIVLLNGQNIEALCDPNTITAGQLFEAIVRNEKYEHNFMLGVAVLISGDFIFLPDDYKIKKVAPDNWNIKTTKRGKIDDTISFTVFLRIKFFLPTNIAKNIQGGDWRYRVYLQLRRATVEGQLTSTIQNLILLAGYALHIEFGEFSFREHGSGDYFLLEHYLPECAITNDMADVKLHMKRAHETRRGLEKSKAIINYITLAQTFRDYGSHFYSAVWATRDGFCRDVWLSIGPKGVTLYSRNNCVSSLPKDTESSPNRIVLQSLPWHHIHTFYYNKKSLYIVPNNHSGLSKMGIKYKLKLPDNKSYFAFWLASLHHRLYLKLYAKDDFVNYLSDEMSCPINISSPVKAECSNYQDSYNLAVRNPQKFRRQVKRRFRVELFDKKHGLQDKENEKPSTEELLKQILLPQNDSLNNSNNQGNSSNDAISSSESCSLPRRQGVKMGTRVFNGMKTKIDDRYIKSPIYQGLNSCLRRSDADLTTTQSDSDDLCSSSEHKSQHCIVNSMKLLPERQYLQNTDLPTTAYVIESPKVCQDAFAYNLNCNESCLNSSLYDRLENMGCVQAERVFVTALLERNSTKALGLQVAEGSDGNVYIKSITSGGPADLSKKLLPGDQIISVNGQTLLNLKYDKALAMLQSAPNIVELIVLQNANKTCAATNPLFPNESNSNQSTEIIPLFKDKVANGPEDLDITDDELLNEEALKTIYALIKLTKDKVINRIKEKGSLNTPNRKMLQKCLSENKMYDEFDIGDYTSQESTPDKRNNQKFNTWRGQVHHRPKRRPLSLSIPTDFNLPDDYLNDKLTNDILLKKSSLKSIQSSLNEINDNSKQNIVSRNIALPRNFGLSRKWLGPVRYPVTPSKNSNVENSVIIKGDVVRRRFIYGAGESEDDQIFL